MSQRQQYRKVEKGESQTQYYSKRKPGRPGRPNSTPQPKYQWISSTKSGSGSGGGSDSAGDPPHSDCHSSTDNSYKKSDGQGGPSSETVAGANSESSAVQNASLTKSGLSGNPSSGSSFPWRGFSSGFVDKEQAHHHSFERETTVSISSMLSKKQIKKDLEWSKYENSLLQDKEDLEQSKNETPNFRAKAKRDIRVNQNSSKAEATVSTSPISSKQRSKQDVEQLKNETPHLQPMDDVDQSKNETSYLRSWPKRGIRAHNNLLKTRATLSNSSISSALQPKEDVVQSKKGTSQLQAKENFEQSKIGTFQLRAMAKKYIPVHHHSSKPETTVTTSSISGKPLQKEELIRSSNETFDLQSRAQRDIHAKVVPSAPVGTSTHDVALDVPRVLVATSSFQHSHNSLELGIPSPQIWTQGMTSASLQIPKKLPIGNSSQVQQAALIPSLQPYTLQPQGMMHYGHRYNFPQQVGYQPGCQFASFNVIQPEYGQNHAWRSSLRRSVKITHPATNEELRLDELANMKPGGSSAQRTHHTQSRPFFLQSPTSVLFARTQMQPKFSELKFNPLAVASNSGHASSASVPFSSKQAAASGGENVFSPMTDISAVHAKKEGNKSVRPLRIVSGKRQSDNHLEAFSGLPVSVTTTLTALPFVAPSTAASFEGFTHMKVASNAIIDVGKGSGAIGGPDVNAKELQNPSKKYNFHSQQFSQAENSRFPDDSLKEACEVKVCHNNILSPLKEVQQADTILEAPMNLEHSSSGNAKLEIINPEAAYASGDRCGASSMSPGICLPGAPAENQENGKAGELSEQQGSNLFEEPFVNHIYEENNGNILRLPEVKGKTEDLHGAKMPFCNEIANSRYEDNASYGALSRWNSETVKAQNDFLSYSPSLLHTNDSRFGASKLDSPSSMLRVGVKVSKKENANLVDVPSWRVNDNASLHLRRPQGAASKGKKKRKGILHRADTGATSDLYVVYKDQEENLQLSKHAESQDTEANLSARRVSSCSNEEIIGFLENVQGKTEPEDCKIVAEASTLELEMPDKIGVHQYLGLASIGCPGGTGRKRYSRDFLLKYSKQFTEIPADFQFARDTVEGLIICSEAGISRVVNYDSCLGRKTDRPNKSSHLDHHVRMEDDNRWTKSPALVASELEQHFGFARGMTYGFYPGRGGTLSRNLHGQAPGQHARTNQTGLLPSPTSHGGRSKAAGADHLQQATAIKKGAFPSPHSPLQFIHKAEKKYEVHKVKDAEEAKQRQLKAILNKLTPQNFDRLFQQVKEAKIDNVDTLAGLISQIFDKALMEPTFSEMYAKFCYHLVSELPDFVEGHEKITFKRLLLNKCQEEFERGEREQAEANRTDGDGEVRLSEKEREEKRIRARRRMLGNIRLIGELYKKKMLTEKIMHECIQKLLGNHQSPDEEDIEALCKLMSTIGEIIDHPKAKDHMDAYFEEIVSLSKNRELSSRMRFMLKDVIDLRKNKWQQRRKVEGPKTIDELHNDAAQERRALAQQLTSGLHIVSPNKRASADSGPWPSALLSPPTPRRSVFRTMPSQVLGLASQDVRLEDRHLDEHGPLLVPIPRRSIDDNSINFGSQGGLDVRMSFRSPPTLHSSPLIHLQTGIGESRKVSADPNGSGSAWRPHNSKQPLITKNAPDIFMQTPFHNRSNRRGEFHHLTGDLTLEDCSLGRSVAASSMSHHSRSTLSSNISPGKLQSQEHLGEMSVGAICHFYSAGDESEVIQCVRDINSPSFYPSLISKWVTDSFERRDRDRNLLAGLLGNLTKSRNGIFSPTQLIEGIKLALATLDNALSDTPQAALFLGQLLGRMVTKSVLSIREITRLIQQCGEDPGHLLAGGLRFEVLKSAFETIKSEKGESVLKEMCRCSNVKLDDFCPAGSGSARP